MKTYIIESKSTISFDQNRNEYYKYIYNDDEELIRKELNFIFTPMICLINKEEIITKIYFPETNSNVEKIILGLLNY